MSAKPHREKKKQNKCRGFLSHLALFNNAVARAFANLLLSRTKPQLEIVIPVVPWNFQQ